MNPGVCMCVSVTRSRCVVMIDRTGGLLLCQVSPLILNRTLWRIRSSARVRVLLAQAGLHLPPTCYCGCGQQAC